MQSTTLKTLDLKFVPLRHSGVPELDCLLIVKIVASHW